MIDDLVSGIALRGLERRVADVRDGLAHIEKAASNYVEGAAYQIRRAAQESQTRGPAKLVNKQSFESIATRLQKFAENGFTPSDVARFGVANAETLLDADEVSDEAKMGILMKAAGALVAQSSPTPASTLALLFD